MRVRLEAERGELQEKSKELLRAVAARIAYVDDSALELIDKAKGERPDPLDRVPVIKELLDRVHVAYSTHVHSMVSEIENMLVREGLLKKANGDEDDEFMGFTPQTFSADHMHEIREAVQNHHDSMIASFAGPQALPAGRRAQIATAEDDDRFSPIGLAFLFGLLWAHSDNSDRVKDMSYSSFEEAIRQGSLRLPERDLREIKTMEMEAGQRLQHLGSEVALAASLIAADAMRGINPRDAADRLRQAATKWSDRWDRLARTVLHTAKDRGAVARYKVGDLAALDTFEDEDKETYVYRQTQADSCPYCSDFYNGPDGHPRIFKLAVLEANGTNAGKSKSSWGPVIGATHPHCRCTTHIVPAGHGFSPDGELVADGPFGVRYDTEKSFKQSFRGEIALQKSFRIQDTIDFQGLPISIEQLPGQIRSWMDEHGRKGETRMRYAYGHIQNTQGADGEEEDCFVGPDPQPSHVYIVHRHDPKTGMYDEDKAMIGFSSAHHAKAAFLEHYDHPDNLGSMTMVPLEEYVDSKRSQRGGVRVEPHTSEVNLKPNVPKLKAKSDVRLVMGKTLGSFSAQAIAGSSMAENKNPSGGSGQSIVSDILPPGSSVPAQPDIYEVSGVFDGAVYTEEELEHLRNTGSEDKKFLLDAAGYREDNVKPVEIPDLYADLEDQEPEDKDIAEQTKEYMQAWVDQRHDSLTNEVLPARKSSSPMAPGETVTVKKRKFGDVTLKALDDQRFSVRLPKAESFIEFDSLSAACDHVWVVSKGYDNADAYKQQKGVRKIPSGAGWRFWGIKPKEANP